MPPCPRPTLLGHRRVWATSLHVFICFFSLSYVGLWDSNTPHCRTCKRVSFCMETSLSWLPAQDGSPSLNPLSLFLSLIFCPNSFWRDWASLWVPGVLRQHSEVVLWKLLNIQMIFDEFVWEKVVSPSYTFSTLGPLASWYCFCWLYRASPSLAAKNIVLATQSCPILCDPMDYSPPDPSVRGSLQVRILEWVANPSLRDPLKSGIEPRSPALQADSSPSEI